MSMEAYKKTKLALVALVAVGTISSAFSESSSSESKDPEGIYELTDFAIDDPGIHFQDEGTLSKRNVSRAAPLAIVYNGAGTCYSCPNSAAASANLAGFKVVYVNQNLRDYSIFKKAQLYVQPGGKSGQASNEMGPAYRQAIRDFVADGGGYVGFCAGSFYASELVGSTDVEGLGIIKAKTRVWDLTGGAKMVNIQWSLGGEFKRSIYFHGGSYVDTTGVDDPNMKTIAVYPDGRIAGIQTDYGKGKVLIVGAHPEASKIWKTFKGQRDRDGSDQWVAARMMKTAIGR